ncbi:hypothetical protein DFH07DRAFT_806033 [Mycena maculata]|uniref:WW domain-containing protein n=1 Tax=Mycena maculata TaxID=230809 RepID=A0AAD7JR69_9AGAR|nr:hypothetical protein DFH07DRAFT_806033 [Mycena maculata]
MSRPRHFEIMGLIRKLCRIDHRSQARHFDVFWSVIIRLWGPIRRLLWRPTERRSFFPGSPNLTAPRTRFSHHELDLQDSVHRSRAERETCQFLADSVCLSSNLPPVLLERADGATFPIQEGTDTMRAMDFPEAEFHPILPVELLRYNQKPPVSNDPATYTVEPLQTDFRSEFPLPSEWTEFVQFEGQVFFSCYRKDKKIITETWLYDPDWMDNILMYIEIIDRFLEANRIQIPPDSELVLEPRCCDGELRCGYYFVNPANRTIFWLQEVPLDRCLKEIRGGPLGPRHAKIQLEYQYWKHFEFFGTVTPAPVLQELNVMIVEAWADVSSSHISTVNHSEGQLKVMQRLVKQAKKDLETGGRGCPSLVGKFMTQFLYERYINFYGQESARLIRHHSIYGEPSWKERRSRLMSLLSPVLFYAPDVHLKSLNKIWVDRIAAKEPWREMIAKEISEWAEHTAFATILLNANVAFLDIPNVESEGPSQSLTQIFSYISTVLVIGSIILGLMLGRQHRTKHIGRAVEAANFLGMHDLETTAIIYALPYALLMYGMIFFLVAFLVSCFWSTTVTTRLTIGISWAIISMLIGWTLIWQSPDDPVTSIVSWLGQVKLTIGERSSPATGDDHPGEIGEEPIEGKIASRIDGEPEDSAGLEMTTLPAQDTEILTPSSLNTAEMIV